MSATARGPTAKRAPRAKKPPKKPHLTENGKTRFASRERDACGPVQLMARVRAVGQAHRHGDWKMLSGALEDLAAVSIAWAQRVRNDKQKRFGD